MRLLLDTNVLARAAAGPRGPAHELFLTATSREHTLVVSAFLLDELTRVLRYPRLRSIHGLSDEAIDQFVGDVLLVADVAQIPLAAPAVSLDPHDDPIVATAIAGRAEVLCTLDRHLHAPLVAAHLAPHGIAVSTDLELLAKLRSLRS